VGTPDRIRLLNVLLADDASPDSRAAAEFIAALPHARESQITALRVFIPSQTGELSMIEETLNRTRDLLKSRHMHVHTELLLGYPSEKILEYAEQHRPDLIVMGARGLRSAVGLQLGGVAMHLVEDGRWPVLVVRAPFTGLDRVLLVTDGSECSTVACEYLGRFPLPGATAVQVAHVLPPPRSRVYIDPVGGTVPLISEDEIKAQDEAEKEHGNAVLAEAAHTLESHGLTAAPVLLRGDAAEEIVSYAREHDVDLIVAGSTGLGPIRSWLLGSVSRKLVHYSDRNVLIVRRLPTG
jgi:nucleotide-binding universal stress UspA family protein